MIKSNELMIGDWVYARINHPVQVVGITTDSIETTDKEGYFNEKFFDPIPLTPEILEKNGFKDSYIDMELNRDNIFQWYDFYGNSVIIIFKANQIKIQHDRRILLDLWYNNFVSVHELQNTLRICGIEKEVVL